jgi:hypothetical protein
MVMMKHTMLVAHHTCLARYDLTCRSKWSSRVVQVQISDKRRDVQSARRSVQQFRDASI